MPAGTHAPQYKNVLVTPVADQHYDRVAARLIASTRLRCLSTVFIVDVTPRHGRFLVDDLLTGLRAASRRGVDVRIVVSGSNDALAILESSAIAIRRLRQLHIATRWAARSLRPNHSKMLLCDDNVLLGSHNWSADAFRRSTQDSVLVSSRDLCASLAVSFERRWGAYAS